MSLLLLEIYSEEIPARLQDKFSKSFRDIFTKDFSNSSIEYKTCSINISSCRVSIEMSGITVNSESGKNIRGPAVDANQSAISGFLKKNNIPSLDLLEKKDGYFYYKQSAKEIKLEEVLAEKIPNIIDLCSNAWPRRMKWNGYKKEWIRPIRNILCLLNDNILKFSWGGLESNNITFGNKNITSKAKIVVDKNANYHSRLLENFVITKKEERISLIQKNLLYFEKKYNVTVKIDRNNSLLNEIAGLCEYPVFAVGEIPEEFLEVPMCIIESKIKNDQKYFVSFTNSKLSKYIAMFIESLPQNIAKITKGNMCVVNARLSDARFFYQKDIELFGKYKTINEDTNRDLLSNIPVSEKLGSVFDRVIRIKYIMEQLCKIGGIDILGGLDLDTLAMHLKLDISTNAYKEFPDLQGLIGAEYATKIWKLSADYSNAIANQYGTNIGYGEHIPAFANAIEYVASHLYLGTTFNSSSDPFAIERHINFIVSIYEWIPHIGLRYSYIENILPKIFFDEAKKLSELLIKAAKKSNIKRIKTQFSYYLYINEICNYYLEQDISYFTAQKQIINSLDWINISDEAKVVFPIYKRCKNIANINAENHVKLTLVEWSQINDLLDLLDVTIASTGDLFSLIKWNTLSLDLERYFNNHKISDNNDRVIFIKKICSKMEEKYPFISLCE